MRRTTLLMSVALVILIVGSVVTALVLLVQHEPSFYQRAVVLEGPQRKKVSFDFISTGNTLIESIKAGGEKDGIWGNNFTAEAFNCFFAEHFVNEGLASKLLPEGVSEPRLEFDNGCIRLAFRYGTPPWSTIVSVDFKVWLAKDEINVVVLELQGLHAGALPISAQSMLEDISESLRRYNIQVNWYRHKGNPTAALKFQSDQRPTCVFQSIDLKPGVLTVSGRCSVQPLTDRFGPVSPGTMSAISH